MNGPEESKLDELKEHMYERDFKSQPLSPRQRLSPEVSEVQTDWQHETVSEAIPAVSPVATGSFFRKILIFSVLFFLISAGFFLYIFFGGWNMVTSNRVDITFLGPVSTSGGSELDFDIVVANQNRSAIENVVLYIDYPEGTKKIDDLTADLAHEKEVIGEILPKSAERRTARSVQFGELNAHRQIKVTIEYGLKNSNASFRKEKIYDVVISSTPVTITVTHPEEAVSNDTVEFKASVVSNSSVPINNLLIKVDYPFGFAFAEASPKPTYDNTYWVIPTLKPGEMREITIRGQVQGQEGDERVIRYSIGPAKNQNPKQIATQYLSHTESVFLKRPPIGFTISLDGNTQSEVTTEQGKLISGAIDLVNYLPVSVTNTEVKMSIKGKLLDPRSVASGAGGFYRSQESQIVWDKSTFGQLASIEPGGTVHLDFAFSTLPASQVALKNGTVSIEAIMTSNRVATSSTEVISASQKKTILSKTSVNLVPRVVYSVGPFRNRGPIPPKADVKTTYTIIWTATNSLNDVRGAEVKATLPVNVRWLGVTSPQSEVVTWNQDKNEVVWRLGDLAAGAGFGKSAREVAFQVELTPSLSQVDSPATLVQAPTITATDSFTNASLSATSQDLTTRLSTDPKFRGEEERVAR